MKFFPKVVMFFIIMLHLMEDVSEYSSVDVHEKGRYLITGQRHPHPAAKAVGVRVLLRDLDPRLENSAEAEVVLEAGAIVAKIIEAHLQRIQIRRTNSNRKVKKCLNYTTLTQSLLKIYLLPL